MKHLARHATLIGMIALPLLFALLLPETFLTARNLTNILQQSAMLIVVATVMTVVMVTGDFDLSVGAMASLAGVVAAVLFVQGWPLAAGLGAALAVGLAGGVANGLLVAVVGILPFVATLATLTMFSGAAFLVSDGRTIFGRDIPPALAEFSRGGVTLWGEGAVLLPWPVLLAAAVVGAAWLALEHGTWGRRLAAVGANPEAARLAGLRVRALRLSAFAVAGAGAALAGLMLMARVASANPTQGGGLMLSSIAAVFLGMTLTENRQPRVLATLAGVLTLGIMDNGLTQLRVDSYVREVLVGAIILAAVSAGAIGARGTGR